MSQSPAHPADRRDRMMLALSASAALLLALALTQIGRLVGGTPALADLVNQSGEFQMLAVDGGVDDIVVVLDHRTESLVTYHATQNALEFLGRRDIREVFAQGRMAAGR